MTIGSKYLRVALLGVVSAAFSASIVAHAAVVDAAPQVHVSYADLNVSSAAGAKTLYGRISSAANNVCPADARDLRSHQAHAACMEQAIGGAVREVNLPQLSRLFTERKGAEIAARYGVSPVRVASY
jgi:UrcA family protein